MWFDAKKALREIKERELAENGEPPISRLAGIASPDTATALPLPPEDAFVEKAILDAYDRGADNFKALKRLGIGGVTLRRVVNSLQEAGKINLREK